MKWENLLWNNFRTIKQDFGLKRWEMEPHIMMEKHSLTLPQMKVVDRVALSLRIDLPL